MFNLDHQRIYAMKVLVDAENADLALHEFNQVQPHLPAHPNIVRIVWMDRLGPPLGHPYIVSEFVKGETLEPYCADERRLAWSDIQKIGIELLEALEALHDHGVYHRDIKPANGRRPYAGGDPRQNDPHWRDHLLFHEYFHGDTGLGLGASHQTGWTALVAKLLLQRSSG